MVGIVEDKRSRLIDRCHPRARGRIRLRTCMHGKSGKSGRAIGHSVSFPMNSLPRELLGHPAVDEWQEPTWAIEGGIQPLFHARTFATGTSVVKATSRHR